MFAWFRRWIDGGEIPAMPTSWGIGWEEEWFFDLDFWKWVVRKKKEVARKNDDCELADCDVSESIVTVGSLFANDDSSEKVGNVCCGGACHVTPVFESCPDTVYLSEPAPAFEPVHATVPAHSPASFDYTPPASNHHWSGSGGSHSHSGSHSHDSSSSSSDTSSSSSDTSSSSSDTSSSSSDGGGGD